jgi:hypothetical protein
MKKMIPFQYDDYMPWSGITYTWFLEWEKMKPMRECSALKFGLVR